jgi:hypothetical protein
MTWHALGDAAMNDPQVMAVTVGQSLEACSLDSEGVVPSHYSGQQDPAESGIDHWHMLRPAGRH